VAGTASVGEEVWANWLNGALSGSGKLANGLEVLLGSPARWQDWERQLCSLRDHFVFILTFRCCGPKVRN
jgi:hypothetical protein